jgi:hypothetical protein
LGLKRVRLGGVLFIITCPLGGHPATQLQLWGGRHDVMSLKDYIRWLILDAGGLAIRQALIDLAVLHHGSLCVIVDRGLFGVCSLPLQGVQGDPAMALVPDVLTLLGRHQRFRLLTHAEGGFSVQAIRVAAPLPKFLHDLIELGVYQGVEQLEVLSQLPQLLPVMLCYLCESTLLFHLPLLF